MDTDLEQLVSLWRSGLVMRESSCRTLAIPFAAIRGLFFGGSLVWFLTIFNATLRHHKFVGNRWGIKPK